MRSQKEKGAEAPFANLARPERFELPTTKFVAWYSIQLSYGREEAELLGLGAVSSTLTALCDIAGGEGGIRTLDRVFDPILP